MDNNRRKSKRRYGNNSNEEVIFLRCYSADRLNAEMEYYGKLGFKLRGKVFTKHYYIHDRGPGYSSTSYCENLSATMVRKATGVKYITYDEMLEMKEKEKKAKEELTSEKKLGIAGTAVAGVVAVGVCLAKAYWDGLNRY